MGSKEWAFLPSLHYDGIKIQTTQHHVLRMLYFNSDIVQGPIGVP